MSFDAREKVVELEGDVRVDASPFHLRSEHLTLTRTNLGIDVEGNGSLTFCPCLGTPVRIDFTRAIVAPPGDVLVRSPTLRIYGVPALYLPYFWLRSSEKVGLLPPDVAYRGQDGVYLGGGVHLPWRSRSNAEPSGRSSVDLRGGAYLLGGFVVDARVRTPSSTTTVRFDRRTSAVAPPVAFDEQPHRGGDDGLRIDARGSARAGDATTAWDVDALRGRRGVVASTDLDEASRPWDRGAYEGAFRKGPLILSTGVRAVARRGTLLSRIDAIGPVARARIAGILSPGVTYDVTTEGGALRIDDPARPLPSSSLGSGGDAHDGAYTLSFARAEAGLSASTTLGPFAASSSARGVGDVALDPARSRTDRAGSLDARLGLPLVRTYGGEGKDPVVHVVEPFARAALVHAEGDGMLGLAPGRALTAVSGTAPIVTTGVATALGRTSTNDALEAELAAGAAGADALAKDLTQGGPVPLARGRVTVRSSWLGMNLDGALTLDHAHASGGALLGRVRLGKEDGPRILGNVATREGTDPVLARALSGAPLEPSSGFLSRAGTTAGGGVVVPWSQLLTTSAGADVDASSGVLVAARAGVELRDRCGCVTVRAFAARRIGRGGFDAWVAIDLGTRR